MAANSDTFKLAHFFVTEVLCRGWTTADFGGTHMAHAKKLLKMGYKLNDLRACIMSLVDGMFDFEDVPDDFEFKYMSSILKGEPPYIEQFLAIPSPPPVYEVNTYDAWVVLYGKRAIAEGKWDGIYWPMNQPYRLTDDDIALILGEEFTQRALEEIGRICLCTPLWTPLRSKRSG